jgi:hypothetical protein
MSVALAVILECGPIPDGVVAPETHCGGQNIPRHLGTLAAVAERLGVPPLDAYFVFPEEYWETALDQAGWRYPGPPADWGDSIPLDGRPITDPVYLAAMAEHDRILERARADLPWHDPADGLATVRALVAALESDPELDRRCYGAVWDLRAFRLELEYAERAGTRFYLTGG